jgi:hypothetical protein
LNPAVAEIQPTLARHIAVLDEKRNTQGAQTAIGPVRAKFAKSLFLVRPS